MMLPRLNWRGSGIKKSGLFFNSSICSRNSTQDRNSRRKNRPASRRQAGGTGSRPHQRPHDPGMNLFNAISIGVKEIWAHKFRSVLTMMGIILGVSSLVAMSALVKGMENG